MAPLNSLPDAPKSRELVKSASLEMTGRDVWALWDAAHLIPAGTKINVTFLSAEEPGDRIAAVRAVKELGFTPVPHIAARRLASQAELEEYLGRLQELSATEHVFVVGGDPAEPVGPYPDALSVIRTGILPEFGVREVSIAGYPDGHPDIGDELLWHHLEQKSAALQQQELGATIITQFGFDADAVLSWIRDVRDRGIDTEIRVGAPGPAGIKRILGFARRVGVGVNAMVVRKYGFSLTNLLGTAGPDRFVSDLSNLVAEDPRTGRVGLHLYTFGGLVATSTWMKDYSTAPSASLRHGR